MKKALLLAKGALCVSLAIGAFGVIPAYAEEETQAEAVSERDLLADYAKITSREDFHINPEDFPLGDGIEDLTIGVCMGNVGSSFYKNVSDSVENTIRELGATPLVSDAGGDFQTQVNQLQNFITQGVDGIVLNPADPVSSLESMLTEVAEAGIPVVAVDNSLSLTFDYCLGNYGSDNYEIGKLCGQYVAEKLIDKYGELTGKIGCMGGIEGVIPSDLRYAGFWDAFDEIDPDNTVEEVAYLFAGDYTEEGAMGTSSDILTAHPDVDAMFGPSDTMIVAANAEIERRGMQDKGIILAACDGSKSGLKLIKDGKDAIIGFNDPIVLGRGGAYCMVSYLTTGFLPESRTMMLQPVAATPDNIDEYYDPDSPF